ncbi:MAG: tetratricopeptide repeat protein [Acidobacteriia bacterium]|nr:tetratricopeptide repeat protein [Terriglobia bacterium]
MRSSRSLLSWLLAALLLLSLAGCSRDPVVRKRRHFQKAESYFQQGKYPEAIIEYASALQIDKEYAEAHYGVARCYMKLGAYSAAYVELARTVELQPENQEAHVQAGILLLANGNFDEARKHAEFVLQPNPNQVDARVLLADVYAALGQMYDAFREMDKAIKADPNRPSSYLNLAILQGSAGQTGPAEENFKKAMAMDPNSIAAVMATGEFFEQLRRGPEAEALYRHAMTLDPKDPRPRAALVRIFLAQGKVAQAEQFLQQAVKDRNDLESMRQLADFYLGIGDLARATFQYAAVHQRYPKDLLAKKYYVQLLIFSRRLLEAEKLNDEILVRNVRDSEALLMRAQIFLAQDKAQDAADLLDKLILVEPENALAHHYLGIALDKLGNRTRAESEWREAARLRPGLLEAQQMLVQLALQSQNYELLDQSVTQLINARPSTPRWYVYRAMAEMQRSNLSAAEGDLTRAIQIGPQSPMAYSKMGLLRRKQDRFKEAEQFFEKALDRDPAYFESLQGLADLYMDQKKPDAALARVKAQVAKLPNNTHFNYLLGSLYLRLGERIQAESAFKNAVAADGGNVDALVVLAQLFYERGAVESASGCYEQAIRTHPNDPRAYVLLGSIREFRGDLDRARELYQKALRVRPDYPMAANNLAYLMLEHGDNLDIAASLAQVAHKGMPESPAAADTLGWAYCKKGAYTLAIDLLEDALRRSPNDAAFHYHLALAYLGAHERDRARTHFQKVLQLNPNDAHAEQIQQALKKLERG